MLLTLGTEQQHHKNTPKVSTGSTCALQGFEKSYRLWVKHISTREFASEVYKQLPCKRIFSKSSCSPSYSRSSSSPAFFWKQTGQISKFSSRGMKIAVCLSEFTSRVDSQNTALLKQYIAPKDSVEPTQVYRAPKSKKQILEKQRKTKH